MECPTTRSTCSRRRSTATPRSLHGKEQPFAQVAPVYSGDDHGAKQIDAWVKEYKDHAEFGYIFRENARDVLNKQNPESVKKTLAYLASLVA